MSDQVSSEADVDHCERKESMCGGDSYCSCPCERCCVPFARRRPEPDTRTNEAKPARRCGRQHACLGCFDCLPDAALGIDDHAIAGMLSYLVDAIENAPGVPTPDLERHLREATKRAKWLRERAEQRVDKAPVDWAAMPAEAVAAAIASRPSVFRPWEKWTFATGWSRHEVMPPAVDGGMRHLSIQPSTEPGLWHVSGLDAYGVSRMAMSEEEALRMADTGAIEKGWKLLGEVKS